MEISQPGPAQPGPARLRPGGPGSSGLRGAWYGSFLQSGQLLLGSLWWGRAGVGSPVVRATFLMGYIRTSPFASLLSTSEGELVSRPQDSPWTPRPMPDNCDAQQGTYIILLKLQISSFQCALHHPHQASGSNSAKLINTAANVSQAGPVC